MTVLSDKDIEFFYEHQTPDGGFSFKSDLGEISQTFWIVYTLKNYSWLIEYNPTSVFSFISEKLIEIISDSSEAYFDLLPRVSMLTILLSQIWDKFIEQIERVIFKQLEKEQYIDIGQIRRTFGLDHGIEDVILYINLSYNFNLELINNKNQFDIYLENLSTGVQVILREFYSQLSNKSIVSLSDIHKKYKSIIKIIWNFNFKKIEQNHLLYVCNHIFIIFCKVYFVKKSVNVILMCIIFSCI